MTRQEAIQELQNCKGLIQQDGQDYLDDRDIPILDMAIESLSAEAVQGEWISNHDGSWNCSECGLRVFVYAKGNFCPNCGAKMTKGGDNNESIPDWQKEIEEEYEWLHWDIR